MRRHLKEQNILEERAQGDAQARKERAPRKRAAAKSAAVPGSLWSAADHLVDAGWTPALARTASALTSLVGGAGLDKAFAGQPARFTPCTTRCQAEARDLERLQVSHAIAAGGARR